MRHWQKRIPACPLCLRNILPPSASLHQETAAFRASYDGGPCLAHAAILIFVGKLRIMARIFRRAGTGRNCLALSAIGSHLSAWQGPFQLQPLASSKKWPAHWEKWQYLEQSRKKPWRLVAAFGWPALIRYALGLLSLDGAFRIVSTRLGLVAKPILLPFAEAAIDVDKPSDLALAGEILKLRD